MLAETEVASHLMPFLPSPSPKRSRASGFRRAGPKKNPRSLAVINSGRWKKGDELSGARWGWSRQDFLLSSPPPMLMGANFIGWMGNVYYRNIAKRVCGGGEKKNFLYSPLRQSEFEIYLFIYYVHTV